jgi:hypothetical protein
VGPPFFAGFFGREALSLLELFSFWGFGFESAGVGGAGAFLPPQPPRASVTIETPTRTRRARRNDDMVGTPGLKLNGKFLL